MNHLIMFLIGFALLASIVFLYIFLKKRPENSRPNELTLPISNTRVSGIEKALIDSLPSFTFSSLGGTKKGLECVVCLSHFEDVEVLRLLPKCKHAFHGSCVEKWLENHSDCPLCRQKVDSEDIKTFKLSSTYRDLDTAERLLTCTSDPPKSPKLQEPRPLGLPYSHSDTDIQLFVQREKKDESQDKSAENKTSRTSMDKFKHKIIVFGVFLSQRWSDVDTSDITSLNSDMMNSTSSRIMSSFNSQSERYISTMLDNTTFPAEDKRIRRNEEMELRRSFDKGFSVLDLSIPSTSDMKPKCGKSLSLETIPMERSVSEITTLSRFSDFTGGNIAEEERMRAWIDITKQTVQKFGSKRRSNTFDRYSGKLSIV